MQRVLLRFGFDNRRNEDSGLQSRQETRQAVQKVQGMPRIRVEWHLDNWSRHQKGGLPQGFPKTALGLTGYTTYDHDSELAHEKNDATSASITDAVIRDLTPMQVCAISHKWLHAIFHGKDLFNQYEDAISILIIKLDKRGRVS